MRRAVLVAPLLLFIAGCWNSIEIDEVIMVMGVGFDKTEKGYEASIEALRSSGKPGEGETRGIVLSTEGETIFQCSRNLIRKTKRRLVFTHTNIWVISEKLARSNFTETIDALTRDHMPRMNSLVLISSESPKEVLATSTIMEDLTSIELAESMQATEFSSQFHPMELKEALEMLSGPVPATYIPMIQLTQKDDETITELKGAAVIKNKHMVGKLNRDETKSLHYLRGEAGVGSITAVVESGQKVSIEALGQKVHLEPTLKGKQLSVNVQIEVQGSLREVPSEMEVNEETIRKMEQAMSQEAHKQIKMVLKKLQQELKTDIVEFGEHVYRKYPREWHTLKDDWEDIFSKAEVNVTVKTFIHHKGLENDNRGSIYNKPQFIPFYFLDGES